MSRFRVNLKMLDWLIYRDEQNAKRLSEAKQFEQAKETSKPQPSANIEVLMDRLCEDDHQVRLDAVKQLATIDDDVATEALVRQMECNNLTVRWAAMNALINKGRHSVRPLLEALTRDMNSSNLRDGAHHVLQNLQHQGYLNHGEVEVLHALDKHVSALEVARRANTALIEAR